MKYAVGFKFETVDLQKWTVIYISNFEGEDSFLCMPHDPTKQIEIFYETDIDACVALHKELL